MNSDSILFFLGKGISKKIIISYISISILLFFYVLTIGSFLQITIYPLIDRVVYTTTFVDIFFINEYWDHLVISIFASVWFSLQRNKKVKIPLLFFYVVSISCSFFLANAYILTFVALSSLPLITIISLIDRKLPLREIRSDPRLRIFLNYTSILGCIIAVISLGISISKITNPVEDIPSINYLYYIYLIISVVSPASLILVCINTPVNIIVSKTRKINNNFHNIHNKYAHHNTLVSFKWRSISLVAIMILSIMVSLIPQITSGNDLQPISSDTVEYVKFVNALNNASSTSDLIQEAFVIQINGDRPLALILFYLLYQIFENVELSQFIDYLPSLLSPLLVLSIYLLTRTLSKNDYVALLTGFLTAFSFQTLIGIYAGLFANWLSLSFAFLAIYLALRFLEYKGLHNLILFSFIFVLLLLTHTPTWTIFLVIVVIFFVMMIALRMENRKLIFFLILALIPSISIEAIRTTFVEFAAVEENISFGNSRMNILPSIDIIWTNLIDSNHIYFGGIFGNTIILALTLYWTFQSKSINKLTMLFGVTFSLGLIFIIFGDEEIQSRILYQIPFQIPVAIGLLKIKRKYGTPLFVMTTLWILTISIRNLTNFNFEEI
ncbi:hypothetical protein [Candidatus Nitrosocosmicus hydrocola]|uniref:hypothetical protein n=1 Tax=Candidatus Nitrosocosmicus hydrocola TaxID=1826872 RepID=UPI0011E5EB7A|nr:hypothetical protein [Candidatus Nitrosocosmicus hydrocola]